MKLNQLFSWNVSLSWSIALGGFLMGALQAGASVNPSIPTQVTDDRALHERLTEIKVSPQKELSFDRDIDRLSGLESRYREKLPVVLSGPVSRVSQMKYKYSGKRK